MLFVIIGHDGPHAKELRPKLRPDHLAYLAEHDRAGRVKLAGPLTDGHGSLIVIDAESEEAVHELTRNDPYTRGGVFESVEIHPFKQVLPSATG